MSNHVCCLCTGTNFVEHSTGLLECTDCGLVHSPVIWEPHSNQALEVAWFGEAHVSRRSRWISLFEALSNRRTLRRLRRYAASGSRILEVGVGSGSLLLAARNLGYDMSGVDLSPQICRAAAAHSGVNVHNEPLGALAGREEFDAVVLNHVVEHVNDPRHFIGEASAVLRHGGIIHVALPNIDSWGARFRGWVSYEPYHLTYFGRDTLVRLLREAGFEILSLGTHESFSGWALVLLRTLAGRNRGDGIVRGVQDVSGSHVGGRSPLVESCYRLALIGAGIISWPLRFLQSVTGSGDELICIGRKSAATDRAAA